MQKTIALAALLFASTFALADSITFLGIGKAGETVSASSNNFDMPIANNILIADTTTGVTDPLLGIDIAKTGVASDFQILTNPNLVVATFTQGPADFVQVQDPITHVPLMFGTMNDRSAFISAYPNATGSFRGTFNVLFLDPSILAMFHQAHVNPLGSIAITFSDSQLIGQTLDAVVGGVTITLQTTAVPEPASLSLIGGGLLFSAFALGRLKRGGS